MGRMSLIVPSMDRHKSSTNEETTVSPAPNVLARKPPRRVIEVEPLLTAEDVADWLNVSPDWVWDHSSRKKPRLPVIRMSDGALRYRYSQIEAFIVERERLSSMRLKRA